jgi:FdhD protein
MLQEQRANLKKDIFHLFQEVVLESSTEHQAVYWDKTSGRISSHKLVGEEPLSIRVQGKPYSVVMRTPGDEIPHVAGFCLGEGIVDDSGDIASLAFCDGADTNVVTVALTESRRKMIPDLLDRREFVSQTSCGICGKELVKDLRQLIRPIPDGVRLDINAALRVLETLSDHQPLRRETRASHAAAIYSKDLELLAVAEDVGRHNALDKAVGKLFMAGNLESAALLTLSSRISYELVQKAARARIPIILAVSRPTALAVSLAAELNMTLACLGKGAGLYIFSAEHRLMP